MRTEGRRHHGTVSSLPDTLKIFPLPGAVLFPDAILPLHVFEPRYRKLLAHALDSDRLVGILLLRPGSDPQEDDAAVYGTGCSGRIVAHEPLPGGRSLMVLRGEMRFRVVEELDSGEPYRLARVQALYEAPVRIDAAGDWREDLRRRLHAGLADASGDDLELRRLFTKSDSAVLVNQLCSTLPLDSLEKQSLLDCPTIDERCETLKHILDFRAAEMQLGLDADRLADS